MSEIFAETIRKGPYSIRFPHNMQLDQDEEWCEVKIDGEWERVRFHDYHRVYQVPGLYETIFYRTLQCVSPNEVVNLFRSVLLERNIDPKDIRVLDFGAGNGMAGETLQSIGVRRIIGVDILEEAKRAAERDRPWVYDDFIVDDFTQPSSDTFEIVRALGPNCLVTVAALGYGDIPIAAFYHAFNMIDAPGWVAMNIKDDFLNSSSRSGFAGLINRLYEEEILQCEMYKRYCHRLNVSGERLYYIALVGKKLRSIPEELVAEFL